ncbi:hypothetical protein A3742_03250 [Oleiphilus sp. HI0071]|nr:MULTISPECIES: tRNA glutamyl-Q(34) synthetase GluQRS [unclassified Oleiphilus]KZY68059.1 hypothetical protein A3737_01695 [Oleiphilus sp. HI0065]KZY82773.1 hypothetical protein A3742_18020 [Oleiphilus sp. HI0071]KZY97200.1 hypothetical protein A3744_13255 [Oleiphilus sp. HI0073]KZZ44192.1 hypothetical protein A3758_19070 [Oleiphilus sp. HI0118]KZZ51645.1 hypothetical protein A3760_12285 [Oleiphilus sp. HI0122]KZZ67383.1 hypothetical protein A3765_04580 [Oleiphilus sp. HI0130]
MHGYIGRFAPSPTGPLHLGSLLAALISYLDARKNQGQWLVRIEDIDPPRERAGSASRILKTLETHGLAWDQDVRYQSSCAQRYEEQLATLLSAKLCYYCPCSRKQLADRKGEHLPSCGKFHGEQPKDGAVRFQTKQKPLQWNDVLLGPKTEKLDSDFILKRRDGLYSYQLAVVSDDIDQKITHVIRGMDLLSSTPMQLALYDSLDSAAPEFGHFPLVTNTQGQKLSKQNLAPAVDDTAPIKNLALLGSWLGFEFPNGTNRPEDYLTYYLDQWDRSRFQPNEDYVI